MSHEEKRRTNPSDLSDRSDPTDHPRTRLNQGGGFRKLRSFQVATIIYDATIAFCRRFVDRRSRTVDQMVQAARSGRQNIAEGSRASATSRESELKLVNVARSSLEELLLDYEDYLDQRGLPRWPSNHPEALAVRAVGKTRTDPSNASDPSEARFRAQLAQPYARWLNHREAATVANALICLIHQAIYLLDRQLAALERDFVREGGYREKLFHARRDYRERQHRTDPSDPTDAPLCPTCGKPMRLRTARQGTRAGSKFWGCSAFPVCRATRPFPG